MPPNEDSVPGKIVPFRSRAGRDRTAAPAPAPRRDQELGLERFERDQASDDYRQRMISNLLAVLVLAFLVAAGVWIADRLAKVRKDQDCVLSGRRNCAEIVNPARQ